MKRVQRKRTKGWKMPENTFYVGRPTKFGNPFRLVDGWIECYSTYRCVLNPWILWSGTSGFDAKDVVDLYEQWLTGIIKVGYLPKPPDISVLSGKDLACFCSLDKPCHADVLLKLANK